MSALLVWIGVCVIVSCKLIVMRYLWTVLEFLMSKRQRSCDFVLYSWCFSAMAARQRFFYGWFWGMVNEEYKKMSFRKVKYYGCAMKVSCIRIGFARFCMVSFFVSKQFLPRVHICLWMLWMMLGVDGLDQEYANGITMDHRRNDYLGEV